MLKRAIDLVGSGLGLLVLSPALLATALAIKLASPGPVFFRQERVGRHGRIFRIFKFRSMTCDENRAGCLVTAGDDARITSLGAFLRRHKLDELPQLINVLKGEMSLVGPRPEVAEFVAAFPAEYDEILRVKPGITHQGTLVFRNEEELLAGSPDPMKLYLERVMPRKLDIYLAHLNQGVIEDLRIILATVFPRGRNGALFTTGRLQTAGVAMMNPLAHETKAKREMKESA